MDTFLIIIILLLLSEPLDRLDKHLTKEYNKTLKVATKTDKWEEERRQYKRMDVIRLIRVSLYITITIISIISIISIITNLTN